MFQECAKALPEQRDKITSFECYTVKMHHAAFQGIFFFKKETKNWHKQGFLHTLFFHKRNESENKVQLYNDIA